MFKKLLEFATSGLFLFNNEVFRQIDGVSMGSCLAPSLANLFLAHLEKDWHQHEYSPKLYKRYVDDIFLVFNDKKHIEQFLELVNKVHSNLKFTVEVGDSQLPFLDVLINKNHEFFTSTYRKKTFTGLLLNFCADCPVYWKRTLVVGMLHRIYEGHSKSSRTDAAKSVFRNI